jgi:hypothetical protein
MLQSSFFDSATYQNLHTLLELEQQLHQSILNPGRRVTVNREQFFQTCEAIQKIIDTRVYKLRCNNVEKYFKEYHNISRAQCKLQIEFVRAWRLSFQHIDLFVTAFSLFLVYRLANSSRLLQVEF